MTQQKKHLLAVKSLYREWLQNELDIQKKNHSFQIEWNVIVVIVFLSILNQMELFLVQNREENCHDNHIPFERKTKMRELKGILDDSRSI